MVAVIEPRGVVRATGADAATYLQGQVSQDIDAIGDGSSAWSLVLGPTGKLVSWFRIHRIGAEEFVLDMEPAAVDNTVERLERFRLRTDVDFSVERGWRLVSSRTDSAPVAGALTADVDWPGFAGTDALVAPDGPDPTIDADPVAFEAARIGAGVPRFGIDIGVDTIPAEGGAAFIEGAVSFTKGCYTGQELVARIDSRGGNVPRPLRLLRGEAQLSVGSQVLLDGVVVGVVTSAAGVVALAPVMRKAEPGAAVQVGGVAATIAPAPSQSPARS